MKVINTALLTPGNIIVIAVIGVLVHLVASPLYKMIDNGTSSTTAATGS